jgi:hypothetical protein
MENYELAAKLRDEKKVHILRGPRQHYFSTVFCRAELAAQIPAS